MIETQEVKNTVEAEAANAVRYAQVEAADQARVKSIVADLQEWLAFREGRSQETEGAKRAGRFLTASGVMAGHPDYR